MIPTVLGATLLLSSLPCELLRPDCSRPAEELAVLPRVTRGTNGRPGDPVNLLIVGSASEVLNAFHAADWYRPDRESLPAAVKTAEAALHLRRYPQLPVSRLWLFGRPQDLAFSQPVGRSVKRRHHIRLWRSPVLSPGGRPVWFGASTYDIGMHPLKLMHRIGREVDAERDAVLEDLWATGLVREACLDPWSEPTAGARNAEGDPYVTDGQIAVVVLAQLGTDH